MDELRLGSSISSFHKILKNGLGWEQNGFWVDVGAMGQNPGWKICWLGSLEPRGPASPMVPFLQKKLSSNMVKLVRLSRTRHTKVFMLNTFPTAPDMSCI